MDDSPKNLYYGSAKSHSVLKGPVDDEGVVGITKAQPDRNMAIALALAEALSKDHKLKQFGFDENEGISIVVAKGSKHLPALLVRQQTVYLYQIPFSPKHWTRVYALGKATDEYMCEERTISFNRRQVIPIHTWLGSLKVKVRHS